MTTSTGRTPLFGPPQLPETQTSADGKRALFSAPPRRKGSVVIECEQCQARTPVSVIEVGLRLVPGLWLPWRAFPRLALCPSCGRLTWSRVHWRTLLG